MLTGAVCLQNAASGSAPKDAPAARVWVPACGACVGKGRECVAQAGRVARACRPCAEEKRRCNMLETSRIEGEDGPDGLNQAIYHADLVRVLTCIVEGVRDVAAAIREQDETLNAVHGELQELRRGLGIRRNPCVELTLVEPVAGPSGTTTPPGKRRRSGSILVPDTPPFGASALGARPFKRRRSASVSVPRSATPSAHGEGPESADEDAHGEDDPAVGKGKERAVAAEEAGEVLGEGIDLAPPAVPLFDPPL